MCSINCGKRGTGNSNKIGVIGVLFDTRTSINDSPMMTTTINVCFHEQIAVSNRYVHVYISCLIIRTGSGTTYYEMEYMHPIFQFTN